MDQLESKNEKSKVKKLLGRKRRLRKSSISATVIAGIVALIAVTLPGISHADQYRNGHWIYGSIEREFVKFLNPNNSSRIGEPTSGELCAGVNCSGRWQEFGFTNRILWSPNVDTMYGKQIGGLIMQEWLNRGYELGSLGFPTNSESQATGGRFNHFQGGSVYWKNGTTRAYTVWGDIRTQWQNQGWENGSMGWPISNEYDYQGGKRQDFEGGYLNWNTGPNNYNRNAAVAYTDQWVEGRNPAYRDFGSNDCTNFMSQALFAGGLQFRGVPNPPSDTNNPDSWFSTRRILENIHVNSHTWSVAPELFSYLQTHNFDGRQLGNYFGSMSSVTQKSAAQIPYQQLSPGDILFYDLDNDGIISHASMVTGKNIVTTPNNINALSHVVNMHSTNRRDTHWSLKTDSNASWTDTIVYVVHVNDSAR